MALNVLWVQKQICWGECITIRYPYYSFKIFLCFRLIQIPGQFFIFASADKIWKTFAIFDKMTQSIVQAIIKKGSKTEKPWRRRCQPTASKIAKTTKFRAGTKYGHNGWSTTATCTISAWINNPFLSLTCRRTGKWRLKLFIDWGKHVLFLSIYYFKWSMNEETIIEFGFCTDVENFMPSRLEFIFSYWSSYCMHG